MVEVGNTYNILDVNYEYNGKGQLGPRHRWKDGNKKHRTVTGGEDVQWI
jgi:hypothetical protein